MEVRGQIKLLNDLGYSKKAIARELRLSKNTVKGYLSEKSDPPGSKTEEKKSVYLGFSHTFSQSLDALELRARSYGENTVHAIQTDTATHSFVIT